jgi:hypothetical protein
MQGSIHKLIYVMATKEEVQNIVINSYRKYLSDDEKWIVIGNAFIPIENVVDCYRKVMMTSICILQSVWQ